MELTFTLEIEESLSDEMRENLEELRGAKVLEEFADLILYKVDEEGEGNYSTVLLPKSREYSEFVEVEIALCGERAWAIDKYEEVVEMVIDNPDKFLRLRLKGEEDGLK